MDEGCAGTEDEIVTLKVLSSLCPQLFTALTLTVPPLLPDVTCMLVDVELPDHPDGKVHI